MNVRLQYWTGNFTYQKKKKNVGQGISPIFQAIKSGMNYLESFS